MNNWPAFLPPPYYADFETYRCGRYSLKSMDTVSYIRDDQFFAQALAFGDPVTKTNGVIWHDQDIQGHLDRIDTEQRTLVCHNAQFDGKIMRDIYGKDFGVYVCTQSMARAVLRHLSKGFGLDAVYESLFGVPVKSDALSEVEGIREVPQEMRGKYGKYAMTDVVAMIKVLHAMIPNFPDTQWWHMDWCIRQFVDPVLRIDISACQAFIVEYEAESEKLFGKYDAEQGDFASSAKFAEILRSKGGMYDPLNELGQMYSVGQPVPRVPTVRSAATGKLRYDFSKKSEPFINDVLESDDATIRELGQLRLRASSSSEVAQARSLKHVAKVTNNQFALAVNYSGCATHRISGNGSACGINVLAIKRGSRMRHALAAPPGHKILSFDFSAFELGICRFLAQDKPAIKALSSKTGDLYVDFARVAYKDETITKTKDPEKRDVGKTSSLQLQYNSGAKTLRSQLLEKGVHLTMQEAEGMVHTFRHVVHKDLYKYWSTFGAYIPKMQRTGLRPFEVKNAPFLQIEFGGIRLPNDMFLQFPDLQKRGGDWTYQKTLGKGFTRDKIYGGKLQQYCCQALANVIVQERKRMIAREFGLRCVDEIYDEIVLLAPLSFTESQAQEVMKQVVKPLVWWPELPLSCEYATGSSWGGCEKDKKVFGPQFVD